MKKKKYIVPSVEYIETGSSALLAGSYNEKLNGKLDDEYMDIGYGGEGNNLLGID